MTLPSGRDWLFSAKTYLSAVLAMGAAMAFDLPRPYWAMTAVYVVSNPLAGATVSKSFDRVAGTLLGAAAAVVILPPFVNAPELTMAAMALYTGSCLYIALLDRTPRNYAFLLAGYTLPLVALPIVNAPETVFDIAVARSEEIILGIITASIVGTVLFPVSIAPLLHARAASWLEDAASWAEEILRAKGADPATPLARQRLAANITPLNALISQLSHDAGARDAKRRVRELRRRLLYLLPVLSSVADRLHALKLEEDALTPELSQAADRIADWIKAGGAPGPDEPEDLRRTLAALEPPADERHRWQALLRSSLLSRLRELVDLWQDCLALRDALGAGAPAGGLPPLRHRAVIGDNQHYDWGLMLFSAGSTICAIFVASLAWIWSGWTDGANFVAFVAIACCFFGGQDRPAPFMRTMLLWVVISYAVTGVYFFAILPSVTQFEVLVLVLAPPFLLAGALIPRPQLALAALLLAANVAGDLGIQNRFSVDFASFLNSGIAIAAGVLFSSIWTVITKPFGAELAAQRLVRAGWADLAGLATGSSPRDSAALLSRSLDRLGQLMPRLASDGTRSLWRIDGLAELRIGYNVVALQHAGRGLQGPERRGIDTVLAGIAGFFRRRGALGAEAEAPADLRRDIDLALAALDGANPVSRHAGDALVGLRRALFPYFPGPEDTYSPRPGTPLAAE